MIPRSSAEEGVTYGEAISQAYSDVRSDVEKLCQAYDDAYQAAKDSFEGQFDLFDQASTKSSDYLNASVSNAQAALDSQLNYWNTYTANIETLDSAVQVDVHSCADEVYRNPALLPPLDHADVQNHRCFEWHGACIRYIKREKI